MGSEPGYLCRYKLLGCRPDSLGWYGAVLRLWAGAFYCWASLANVLNQSRHINMQGSVQVQLLSQSLEAANAAVIVKRSHLLNLNLCLMRLAANHMLVRDLACNEHAAETLCGRQRVADKASCHA